MNKTMNINVIKEKTLTNIKGKKFSIVEVKPEIVFILDENNNFVDTYCGNIDEDNVNLKIINNL